MDCENCVNFVYNEETDEYICRADMDEDDFSRLYSNNFKGCPFFRLDDEYSVVRKQN